MGAGRPREAFRGTRGAGAPGHRPMLRESWFDQPLRAPKYGAGRYPRPWPPKQEDAALRGACSAPRRGPARCESSVGEVSHWAVGENASPRPPPRRPVRKNEILRHNERNGVPISASFGRKRNRAGRARTGEIQRKFSNIMDASRPCNGPRGRRGKIARGAPQFSRERSRRHKGKTSDGNRANIFSPRLVFNMFQHFSTQFSIFFNGNLL